MIPKASIICRGQWKQAVNSAKYLDIALVGLEHARTYGSNHDRARLIKKRNRCKQSIIDQVRRERDNMEAKAIFLRKQLVDLERTGR
jgi:hypothetical protein